MNVYNCIYFQSVKNIFSFCAINGYFLCFFIFLKYVSVTKVITVICAEFWNMEIKRINLLLVNILIHNAF